MPNATSNPKFINLCERLEQTRREMNVPGVALGVLCGDDEWHAGFGVTSIENPLPVTPETLFQCGSITKTFVGATVMRWVEKSKIDLDAPIQKYLPDFKLRDKDAEQRATMRHLLTHTSGWLGDHFDDFGYGDDAVAKIVSAMQNLPQWTPLGDMWSYNNVGFSVAARIVEVVSGKTFEQNVKSLVFDPLGMTRSCFMPTEAITHRFAVGHEDAPNGLVVARPWELGRANHPAGGLMTNTMELIRYARCFVDDGKPLLKSKTVREMTSKQVKATGRYDFGLTWWLTRIGKDKMIQHGGATNGQTALLRIVPSRKFAIVLLTNYDNGSRLNEKISHIAIRAYLGKGLDKVEAKKMRAKDLKEYEGHYTAHLTNQTLRVHDGTLTMQTELLGRFPTPSAPPPPKPLNILPEFEIAFFGDDKIFIKDEPHIGGRGEFVRDGNGKIAWLRWGGRLHRRMNG
jgi:CubicO group peptidase (beta-lactamase class C family)